MENDYYSLFVKYKAQTLDYLLPRLDDFDFFLLEVLEGVKHRVGNLKKLRNAVHRWVAFRRSPDSEPSTLDTFIEDLEDELIEYPGAGLEMTPAKEVIIRDVVTRHWDFINNRYNL